MHVSSGRRVFLGGLVVSVALLSWLLASVMRDQDEVSRNQPAKTLALAVLGNSDSHAYQDRYYFPEESGNRGGDQRPRTFQWTEVIARLRGEHVDQGEWGLHGTHPRIARVASWFGVHLRSPKKQDYAYNFAISGARCANLAGERGQVAQLVNLLKRDPERWNQGAVVIRIGINDIGRKNVLDQVANKGFDAESRMLVRECVGHIGNAVQRTREAHASVRVILVGIADNASWPPNFESWHSAAEMSSITAFHDEYDNGLREIARTVPGVSFFDDRAWFTRYWGGRDAEGRPAFRDVCIGNLVITHAQGDLLQNTILVDGHAGTALNALFAGFLLQSIAHETQAKVAPITTEEIGSFLGRLRPAAPGGTAGSCPEETKA